MSELVFDNTDHDFRIHGDTDNCLTIHGTMHSILGPQYFYEPKEDITAYELALVLKAGWSAHGIELLPDGAKRHFRKAD